MPPFLRQFYVHSMLPEMFSERVKRSHPQPHIVDELYNIDLKL